MTDDTTRLNRQDWTIAALSALAQGGVETVKVDRLARDLKVSRGSFYWHFKDRGDLLVELLALWKTDLTDQLIADAWELNDARDRLRAVARASMDATVHGVDVARAEGALRVWASHDDLAAKQMREVDATRVTYLDHEFCRIGLATHTAGALARGVYMTLLGLFVARTYNPDLADDEAWMAIVDLALESSDVPIEPRGS